MEDIQVERLPIREQTLSVKPLPLLSNRICFESFYKVYKMHIGMIQRLPPSYLTVNASIKNRRAYTVNDIN